MPIQNLVNVLQASVAPCVLISGVGLLLLTMSNRLGRPIDRARALCNELSGAQGADRDRIRKQIAILYRRCRVLQAAIALAITSVFFVSVVILLLFSALLHTIQAEAWIQPLFGLSLLLLIGSLLLLLVDIVMTLGSVRIEIADHLR